MGAFGELGNAAGVDDVPGGDGEGTVGAFGDQDVFGGGGDAAVA